MTILQSQTMTMPKIYSAVEQAQPIDQNAKQTIDPEEKWARLSPFLTRYGCSALAYATLQDGLDYFLGKEGYLAFKELYHPILAPRKKALVFSDPVCDVNQCGPLIDAFLKRYPRAIFSVISEPFAEVIRSRGFKINCVGYEPEIDIQTYNTRGNWNELDLIRRARNEAKRKKISIREIEVKPSDADRFSAVTRSWIQNKKIKDREIWLFARRPVFDHEPDVRKYVAFDSEEKIAGYVFYDPMYQNGEVFGYSANIARSDEQRFNKLVTAIHMQATEDFKQEGKKVLNLCLAPFVKLDRAKFNDDAGAKWFFNLSAKYGEELYNFSGLSFHKSKYRALERSMYLGVNSLLPTNDIFLAFAAADITQSYFGTMFKLFRGIFHRNP